MAFFRAEKTENGWWVPVSVPSQLFGDEKHVDIKVFVPGGSKSLAQVHEVFYKDFLPALGIQVEDE